MANSGQFDEYGNRLVPNTESNGRFHTDWLNMIYPRLRLAKDLLTDDGVIFISIDENEIENLKKVCDDTFGEKNFVASVIWERAFAPKNDAKYFSDSHDYIVIYAKNLIDFQIGKLPRTEEANSRYKNPDNDPRGPWASDNMTVKTYSANYDYEITTPNGTIMKPADGRCWFTSKERMNKLIEDGRVWFGEDGGNMPRLKRYLADVQQGMTPTTIWKHEDVGHNQEGRQELKKLFDDKGYFDGPKPVRLIERALLIGNLNSDSLILDFFSGSATTAHAVMKYNAEKGTNCKFIMVQVPEETDKKSEAYKSGYKTICEIGKERIRRAGAKIREENEKKKNMILLENEKDAQLFFDIAKHGKDAVERTKSAFKQVDGSYLIDTGFRVLKCDTSNMKDVYYNPADYEADLFDMMTDNIKEDRTPEDLLFQIMLDLGIELSSKIEETVVAGKKVFDVADGFLIACFDANVTDETIKAIAQKQPYYFVMRDSSLANDCVATNFEQIFATYSPDTVRKVL